MAPHALQHWLEDEVQKIGWSEFVRRANGAFTGGALQGWLRGAIPGPANQVVLAQITGIKLANLKELCWQAEYGKATDGGPHAHRKRVGEGLSRAARRALGGLGIAVIALASGSGRPPSEAPWVASGGHSLPLIGRWRRLGWGRYPKVPTTGGGWMSGFPLGMVLDAAPG